VAIGHQLKALLQSYIEGDDQRFLSIAMQVAAHEAKLGHGKLAEDLRNLIDEAKARQLGPLARKPTPIAQPRGDLATLLDVTYPKVRLSDMVLNESLKLRLSRIVKEHRQFSKIRSHGLSPRRKLLLIGPPGTGKTMTASSLAGELGLPLFLVKLDALITKFLGETASKLRLVFDAAKTLRGIYFFDEFDAIASQRGLTNDVGEVRRTLNSFLQMIEQDDSNSLIIAATNHPEILDYAVFRRFDDVIEYEPPAGDLIVQTLKSKLGSFASKTMRWSALANAAASMSYADLTRAVNDAIKDAVIHDKESVSEGDLRKAFDDRRAIRKR
jgi:AAA+ superfamily predicted ATPase